MPNKATAVNRRAPGGAIAAAVQSIAKPEGNVGEKTSCIQCDGYECCCIPIPCTVM